MMRTVLFSLALLTTVVSSGAHAEDYVLMLKDHQFSPNKITVPANQSVRLTVKNEQSTPAEFESSELGREKMVNAGSQVIVNIGPLDTGDYSFFDDFHHEASGVITAK